MFEAMMGQIQDQFVAYVSHLQVAAVEEAPRGPATERMRYSAADDRSRGRARCGRRRPRCGRGAHRRVRRRTEGAIAGTPGEEVSMMPVRVDKTPGRNEPCFCGSGKKYKLCHGR